MFRSEKYNLEFNETITKKFLETVSAFANNFLKKYVSNTSRIESESFLQKSESRYSRQRLGVSVSYRIGELKASVKKAARSINNDDVKGGEGGGDGGSAT